MAKRNKPPSGGESEIGSKRIFRTVAPDWEEVRTIRDLVSDELAHLSEDVQVAAAMTASELLENVVKYCAGVDTSPATFTLTLTPEEIRIETRNRAISSEALDELERQIERIGASKSSEDLYVRRLSEILEDGKTRGKLGLYRIAFEGAFDLRCTNVGDVVTIIATRKMP